MAEADGSRRVAVASAAGFSDVDVADVAPVAALS